MPPLPISSIIGTSAPEGNTASLMKELEKSLPLSITNVDTLNLTPYSYNYDNEGDAFLPFVKEMIKSDTIIWASPVYWYAPSAQLKVFMDRFSDLIRVEKETGRHLRGKKIFVVSTGYEDQVPESFDQCFRRTFDYLGMHYGGMLYCSCKSTFKGDDFRSQIDAFVTQIRSVSV